MLGGPHPRSDHVADLPRHGHSIIYLRDRGDQWIVQLWPLPSLYCGRFEVLWRTVQDRRDWLLVLPFAFDGQAFVQQADYFEAVDGESHERSLAIPDLESDG